MKKKEAFDKMINMIHKEGLDGLLIDLFLLELIHNIVDEYASEPVQEDLNERFEKEREKIGEQEIASSSSEEEKT